MPNIPPPLRVGGWGWGVRVRTLRRRRTEGGGGEGRLQRARKKGGYNKRVWQQTHTRAARVHVEHGSAL